MELGLLHVPQAPVPALEWGPAVRAAWEHWDSPQTRGAVKENSINESYVWPVPFPLGLHSVPCSQTPGSAPSGGHSAIPGTGRSHVSLTLTSPVPPCILEEQEATGASGVALTQSWLLWWFMEIQEISCQSICG